MVDYNEFNNNNFMYHNGVIIISSTRAKEVQTTTHSTNPWHKLLKSKVMTFVTNLIKNLTFDQDFDVT